LYILKRFHSINENKYLQLNEILQDPVKSKIFNMKILEKEGITPVNNSSHEIETSIKYFMMNYFNGEDLNINKETINIRKNIERAAGNIPLFGNGYPDLSFFKYHHKELFIDDSLSNKHALINTTT